jgi:hypothetical protein
MGQELPVVLGSRGRGMVRHGNRRDANARFPWPLPFPPSSAAPARTRERAATPLLHACVATARSVRAPAKSASGDERRPGVGEEHERSQHEHGTRKMAAAAGAVRLFVQVDAAGVGTLLRKGRSLPQRCRSPGTLTLHFRFE